MIQPTGKIHLGNYLGALLGWKDLSMSKPAGRPTQFIFGVADLHALTTPHDPHALRQHRFEALASILATGLDPLECIVYHQSLVPQHTELAWYLTCLASMGSLGRMTQWKLKAKIADFGEASVSALDKTRAGLFSYPVLMAADVLVHKATHVPVGEDQSQHMELVRQLAHAFNRQYLPIFAAPRTLLTPLKRILSLRDPLKKMSKSDPDQSSCIYVVDLPDLIARKIRRAATDSVQGPMSFDMEKRPGISNLINIVLGLLRKLVDETVTDLVWVKDHKQLKDFVTELVVAEFNEQRLEFERLMASPEYLQEISSKGTLAAQESAEKTMREVREAMGLSNWY